MPTAMPTSTRRARCSRNRDEVDVPLVVSASVSQRVARNARPMTGSAIRNPSDVIASVSEAIRSRHRKIPDCFVVSLPCANASRVSQAMTVWLHND
jgi:hypothetical protein